MTVLTTARLSLVPFADEHVDGLNAMNSDAEVMRYLSGRPETRDDTVAVVERVKRCWEDFGYSWWSFMDRDSGQILGAGALQHLRREATLRPDPTCPLEIGWRLRRDCWHRGLAIEAARAIAGFAFDTIQADELFVPPRQRRVRQCHEAFGHAGRGASDLVRKESVDLPDQRPAVARGQSLNTVVTPFAAGTARTVFSGPWQWDEAVQRMPGHHRHVSG